MNLFDFVPNLSVSTPVLWNRNLWTLLAPFQVLKGKTAAGFSCAPTIWDSELLELILAAPTTQILFIPLKMALTWETQNPGEEFDSDN